MQMMDENFAPEQVLPVYDETVQGLMRAFYKERRAYVVKYMSEYFKMSEGEMEALKDKNL